MTVDNAKKQNILIIHNYYQIPGGEDTVVANEKKMLEKHGHKVILYSRNNAELKQMSKLQKVFLPITTVFNPRTYRDIKKLIRDEKIEIVHVHNTLNLVSPAVYYAARRMKVPVVQTIHNFRLLCPGATFYRDGHICEDCVEYGKRMYKNFYIPKPQTEFTYVLVKKILKKVFSDGSKQRLTALWKAMNEKERQETKAGLKRFIAEDQINEILECVDSLQYDLIDLERAHQLLKKKTSNVADNLHYKVFDLKRRFERIVHPTGLFIVLLGVDGAGKTTIAENLKARYVTAFRKIDHYHSRVRVLKDISQLKKDATPIDASNPHGKKQKAGKFTSVAKFGYYFLDFLIGNVKIAIAKIKSTLVLVERYYYDYSIDKVRYIMVS